MAVLKACREAGVKRFSPSEYAAGENQSIDLYAPKEEVWQAVRNSGLEYTRFNCGLFVRSAWQILDKYQGEHFTNTSMDFQMSILATGTPKPLTDVGRREGRRTGEEEALAGLRPWNFVINATAGTADFAADGTSKICWTDIRDIGIFVFKALDLEKWPEDLGMRGDVKSFKEVVEIFERMQRRTWLKKSNSIEEMEAQCVSDFSYILKRSRVLKVSRRLILTRSSTTRLASLLNAAGAWLAMS